MFFVVRGSAAGTDFFAAERNVSKLSVPLFLNLSLIPIAGLAEALVEVVFRTIVHGNAGIPPVASGMAQ